MGFGWQPGPGRVQLSRTRKLGNLIRVECERGDLEYHITERYRIRVTPRDLELTDPLRGEPRLFNFQAGWADEPEKRQTFTDVVALYWHFMDGVWLWLFVLLFVWR